MSGKSRQAKVSFNSRPDISGNLSRRHFIALAAFAATFRFSSSADSSPVVSDTDDELIMVDGWVLKSSDLSDLHFNVY